MRRAGALQLRHHAVTLGAFDIASGPVCSLSKPNWSAALNIRIRLASRTGIPRSNRAIVLGSTSATTDNLRLSTEFSISTKHWRCCSNLTSLAIGRRADSAQKRYGRLTM
jgi:hypothetical protein